MHASPVGALHGDISHAGDGVRRPNHFRAVVVRRERARDRRAHGRLFRASHAHRHVGDGAREDVQVVRQARRREVDLGGKTLPVRKAVARRRRAHAARLLRQHGHLHASPVAASAEAVGDAVRIEENGKRLDGARPVRRVDVVEPVRPAPQAEVRRDRHERHGGRTQRLRAKRQQANGEDGNMCFNFHVAIISHSSAARYARICRP